MGLSGGFETALFVVPFLLALAGPTLGRDVEKEGSAAAPMAIGSYEIVRVRYQRLLGNGKTVTAGQVEEAVKTFREQPVSLLIREALQSNESSSGSAKKRWEGRWEAGGSAALSPFDEDPSAPSASIVAEWLDIELRGSEVKTRSVRRWLRDDRGREEAEELPSPGSLRRYTITVVPDSVSHGEVKRRLRELDLATAGARKRLEGLPPPAKAADLPFQERLDLRATYDGLDRGAAIGHLIALRFAAEAEAATARLGKSYGVTFRRDVPLVLITSVEAWLGDGDDSSRVETSLDLRLDELTITSPQDEGVRRFFNISRGVQQSGLEGALLGSLSGDKERAVSTARLMNGAQQSGTSLLVLNAAGREGVDSLGLPRRFRTRVVEAIDQGRDVIIPSRAVDLAGRPRWGFWDVDPKSGVVVGVMEDGQHQGMGAYNKILREVALNPHSARMLGLIAGNINVQFGYMALMLEYGEVTEQLIRELQDMLKNVACSACPQFKIGVEASIKLGEDCFKLELKKEKALDFCEAYGEGFTCAVGMFVASLRGENPLPVRAGVKTEIKLGCEKAEKGK